MQVVCGDQYVDVSTVRRWVRWFKDGELGQADLNDKTRSARPVTAFDQLHQDRVEELIRRNRRIKQKEIAVALEISKERVGHIISVLEFRKVCARWVRRMLSNVMKAERVRISRELLDRFEKEGEDFLKKIITGYETWAHHYDPDNKRQSMEYRHKESPQPKKFKTQASTGKVMLTVFWNSERVVLGDFLEKETKINSQRYIETLTALKRRLERTGIRNETLLQHDKPGLTQVQQQEMHLDAIQRLEFSVLPHTPYIPDLAPSDFHLFPELKKHLKGSEEMFSKIKHQFFFKDGFQKLVQRWRKCIEVRGDFVEK